MWGMVDGAPPHVRRGLVALLVPVIAMTLATGCGSASDPSPPSGVDGLVIPTPSIDPDDFVEEVDNRWLPLPPGSRRTYRVSGEQSGTAVAEVSERTWPVSGVDATVLVTTFEDRRTADFYAQDLAGNVWWLGRDGVWQAGVDGAEAGLAMAAHPRVGDGFASSGSDGEVEDLAVVRSVEASVTVPAGSYRDCVQIETHSPLDPGVRELWTYADGVGLVQADSLEGSDLLFELVEEP